jgi:hypothetical protein
VGASVWSSSSKSKERYKAKAEVHSDAMQEVGKIVLAKMERTANLTGAKDLQFRHVHKVRKDIMIPKGEVHPII